MVRLAVALFMLWPSIGTLAQSQAPTESRQTQFVFIQGAVEKPGRYALTEPMTIVQLVATAGGLKQDADKERLLIVSGSHTDARGNPATEWVNYREILMGRRLAENNVKLQPGDAIFVRSRN